MLSACLYKYAQLFPQTPIVFTHKLPSFLIRKSLKDIQKRSRHIIVVLFLTTSVVHDSQSPRRLRPSDAIRKENFKAWVS